jgi:hypothetical protein
MNKKGRNTSNAYHERFFRLDYKPNECMLLLLWGTSPSKLKEFSIVKGIEYGKECCISCPKLSKELTENYSFNLILGDEKLYLVAKDSISYKYWTRAIKVLLEEIATMRQRLDGNSGSDQTSTGHRD